MDDPWDVKSVRQSTQYVSCMKINGVPLLPPILSKECRKEMQYYKVLAQEVEKRITLLKPLLTELELDSEDDTDAPELPECEQIYETKLKTIGNVPAFDFDKTLTETNKNSNCEDETIEPLNSPKLVIDLNLSINQKEPERQPSQQSSPITDLPERDCNCEKTIKEAREEFDKKIEKQKSQIEDVQLNISITKGTNAHQDDGPPSLALKSFTGSLIDIHAESTKKTNAPPLVRQRSYTVLEPSPQLLAHLEVQSMSTGIEVTSISMSESMSNLSITPGKKRRSWDLESAKSKWSSMAIELSKERETTPRANRSPVRKSATQSAPRARSVDPEKKRHNTQTPKTWPVKSEPRKPLAPQNQTVNRDTGNLPSKIPQMTPKTPKNDSIDPAARIRELYERIQNQQLLQMAQLVEKQKKEQMLLQQVFEEQNNLFYKQLKTIAPKQTIEVKEAWGEKDKDKPVSLSQLINHTPESPELSSTLTETKNYINHCEDVLKKSRDITASLKKENVPDGNITRTHSPVGRARSTPRRRIVYESSSSDREYEPVLTDRTNDTMADLNVTFSTDESSNDQFYSKNTVVNNINNITVVKNCVRNGGLDDISVRSTVGVKDQVVRNGRFNCNVSERERKAATTIVAYAKGFLTRRLMRTEKVQGTVQTIKDALLCALQLHQDREGIRGADVDLHRRLIQQITAACYSLHDTLVASPPPARCALIAADRARQLARTRNSSARSSFSRGSPSRNSFTRHPDIMSMSASYSAPPRKRPSPSAMTQSNYETYSEGRSPGRNARCLSPRRRPWR